MIKTAIWRASLVMFAVVLLGSASWALKLPPLGDQGQNPPPPPSPQVPPTHPVPAPQPNLNSDPQLAARLDALEPEERRDLGVPPTSELRGGSPEAPTPNQIPGGQVITTKGLYSLMQGAAGAFVLLDVLGAPTTLPGAMPALPARAAGNFQDQTQQQLSQYLSQLTRGNLQMPLIFYCLGVNCWQSYNAALRAIHLGYSNVLWYRGGLEAWSKAGLPTQAQQQSPKPSP